MAKRTYGQYCGVARALDLLGERWTLLIVRDLLLGPQRFTDLLDGLPGIGTNLLAARLRELQSAAVVERSHLAPPAGSAVYQLTPLGRELESVVFSLSRWGVRSLGQRSAEETYRPAWLLLSIRALFRPEAAAAISETCELRVDGEVFHVRVKDGRVDIRQGPAAEPGLVLACDSDTLSQIALGAISAEEAQRTGRILVEGALDALESFLAIFPLDGVRALGAGAEG